MSQLLQTADPPFSHDPKSSHDARFKPSSDDGKKVDADPRKDSECNDQEKEDNVNSTNYVNAASTNEDYAVGGKTSIKLLFDLNMPALEDYNIFNSSRNDEDDSTEADMNNLDTTIQVNPNPTIRIHKDHTLDQVIGGLQSATQTRKMLKSLEEHGFIEAMQEELLQTKLQEVWTLVDLPIRKRAIGNKWVFRNKKDEMGIMIRNKARLVAQGYTQEEGIHYDEVFAPIARIKAIRLFLAYASFKDFMVYQMDIKSAFLYGKIEEEMYVCQLPGFEDPNFPDRVYKKELCNAFEKLMHKKFQMSSMGELTFFFGLQVEQKKDGIFISQDKYVGEILKKFGFTEVKTASTPIETQKPLLKNEDGKEVDCVPVLDTKSIQRFPKDFTLQDLKSSSCCKKDFYVLKRLTSWQCKKQIVVANSTTKAEYVAASSCRRQVLWIQNQLLDHGKILKIDGKAVWNGIRVDTGNSKLMLLGINLLILVKGNAARHKLTTASES
ncbi:putative ribonuclease H-like domain-containing protein [Tanacetum coccineum]